MELQMQQNLRVGLVAHGPRRVSSQNFGSDFERISAQCAASTPATTRRRAPINVAEDSDYRNSAIDDRQEHGSQQTIFGYRRSRKISQLSIFLTVYQGCE